MAFVLIWLAGYLRRVAGFLERHAGLVEEIATPIPEPEPEPVPVPEEAREIGRLHLSALQKHVEQIQSEGREVPSHLVAEIERLVGTC